MTLYFPLEPYTPLAEAVEEYLTDEPGVSNALLPDGLFLAYPEELHAGVVRVSALFRARRAWRLALELNRLLLAEKHHPSHLLFLDPMLEALYHAEGIDAELCDTCHAHVPELLHAVHTHLPTR